MPDNVLQSIGLSPEWFQQVMGGVMQDPTQQAPAAPPVDVGAQPQPQNLDTANTPVPQPSVPQDPATIVNTLQAANQPPQVQPQAPAVQASGQRRSLLGTIGGIADVLARVGGATPQYQPTLDAATARATGAQDHQQQVDLNTLKLASNTMDNSTQQGKQIQGAAAQLQAIVKANPQIDPGKAWGLLSQRFGLDPQVSANIFSQIQADPNALTALASGTDNDGKEKYGGNVIYATGPDGKLTAFQAGLGANEGRNILPAGYTPVDPTKFVDAGGQQIGYGAQTGQIKPGLTITKTAKPDTTAEITSREKIAAQAIAAARDRAAAAAAAKAKPPASSADALAMIDNIQSGFNALHGMNALPGDNGGAANNVFSALGRTGAGQYIGEQVGSAAAQKRLEIGKNLSQLQQQLIKGLPASATRSRFEQEIVKAALPDPSKMSFATANTVLQQYRDIYARAAAAANAEKAPAAPARQLPPRLGVQGGGAQAPGRPTVSNW